MRLYHASTVAVKHPDVEHSRPNLDDGLAGYVVKHFVKAEEL